jgi:phosphoglycolate phosphatase-like HAD superfamily hydrolase
MTHTPSHTKKILMFDFDGVLIDTLIPVYLMAREINEDMDLEEYKTFFDGNIHDATRKNGQLQNFDPLFPEKYDHIVREMKIPDILKEAVRKLSASHLLVIVSSTPSASIEKILAREGIRECFADILGADIHKSKAVKIRMLLDAYSKAPHDCLFITDTLGDIREAAACSVPAVAVTWGFHNAENLQKGNPAAIIEDPNDFVSVVENMLK